MQCFAKNIYCDKQRLVNENNERHKMSKIRIGIVGLGNVGAAHAENIHASNSRDFKLAAVSDADEEKAKTISEKYGVPHFAPPQKMYDSGLCDAVIVATPHFWHPPLVIRAARAGLHVLCEKPLASTIGPARAMVKECKKRHKALGVVFHHRTRSIMLKMKQMVDKGVIGEVFRIQLICSNWLRLQSYFDSGAWRGTWDGEGGGVLLNQAPHHLDLFQWIGGMPKRIMGLLSTRMHNIEVEDTANFLLDYGDGKVGYIYATTAEEPGYEQMMICGDKGTLICENDKIKHAKLKVPISEHIFSGESQDVISKASGGQKVTWKEVPLPKNPGGKHILVVRNFVRHLLGKGQIDATGEDALNQLELTNGMYVAGYKNKTVTLPLDKREVERLVAKLIKERSTGKGGDMRSRAMRDYRRLVRSGK